MTLPRPRALEPAVTLLCAVALAMVMTNPYSLHPGSVGRVDSGDGRLSIWNVAWIAHALTTNPSQVLDANIFHPSRHALLYSEANLGAGVLAVPAWLLTSDPYVAHNVVLVITFVLSALAAYALARRLTRSRGASAAAFTPFVFAHTTHIQLLMTFGLPLSALAMHRLVDAPSLGRSVALGLALALQGFACAYYGIFAGLLVGAGVLFYAWARGLWRSPRYWLAAAGSATISVALLMPLLVLYLDLQAEGGVQRSLGNAATYASTWRDYLTSAAWAHRWMLPWLRPWVEVLFPGLVTVTLAGAGLWLGLRRGRAPVTDPGAATAARVRREHTIFYGLLAGLAFWASLGPKAGLYSALYYALPVFSFLRAPARFGVIVVLALAVLAAFAVERWLARMPPTRAAWAGAALPLVVAAELTGIPLGTFPARPVPEPYRVLARLPAGPLVEFPFYYQNIDLHHHTLYMLFSTSHWHPLVNGYSDHVPEAFRASAWDLHTFPSIEAFQVLERRGARYAMVHLDMYASAARREVLERLETFAPRLRLLVRDGGVELYEIVRSEKGAFGPQSSFFILHSSFYILHSQFSPP